MVLVDEYDKPILGAIACAGGLFNCASGLGICLVGSSAGFGVEAALHLCGDEFGEGLDSLVHAG